MIKTNRYQEYYSWYYELDKLKGSTNSASTFCHIKVELRHWKLILASFAERESRIQLISVNMSLLWRGQKGIILRLRVTLIEWSLGLSGGCRYLQLTGLMDFTPWKENSHMHVLTGWIFDSCTLTCDNDVIFCTGCCTSRPPIQFCCNQYSLCCLVYAICSSIVSLVLAFFRINGWRETY